MIKLSISLLLAGISLTVFQATYKLTQKIEDCIHGAFTALLINFKG